MKNIKFIGKLAGILFAIAFICSLLLVLCNNLTEDKIAKLQQQTEKEAQIFVLPKASEFKKIDSDCLKQINDSIVTNALEGIDKNGEKIGYCLKVEPSGFGGKISMIVGINKDFTVSGVKITNMSETPGLGAKADDTWVKQYNGKSGELSVVKSGNAQKNEINAISGATITSKAVTSGVNSALNAAKILSESEGK